MGGCLSLRYRLQTGDLHGSTFSHYSLTSDTSCLDLYPGLKYAENDQTSTVSEWRRSSVPLIDQWEHDPQVHVTTIDQSGVVFSKEYPAKWQQCYPDSESESAANPEDKHEEPEKFGSDADALIQNHGGSTNIFHSVSVHKCIQVFHKSRRKVGNCEEEPTVDEQGNSEELFDL